MGGTCPAQLPAAVPKQLLLQPWMEEAKHCLFAAWISPSASLVGSGRCVSLQPLCGHRPCVPMVVVMEGPPRPPAETPRALCFGRAAQGRVFLRKGPSMLPQPSSLSLSFLPLCQSNPVSSPSEVSIPALAALPCSCSFADRSCRPQTLWETISELCLQNHGEEGTGGGSKPFAILCCG